MRAREKGRQSCELCVLRSDLLPLRLVQSAIGLVKPLIFPARMFARSAEAASIRPAPLRTPERVHSPLSPRLFLVPRLAHLNSGLQFRTSAPFPPPPSSYLPPRPDRIDQTNLSGAKPQRQNQPKPVGCTACARWEIQGARFKPAR